MNQSGMGGTRTQHLNQSGLAERHGASLPSRTSNGLQRILGLLVVVLVGLGGTEVLAVRPQVVISANVTTSTTWVSTNEYVLNGLIYVTNSATLTIQPGTVIRGMPDSDTAGDFNPGTLIVARGAQLIANGTAANPIIFTDMDDDNVPGGAHASATYNNNPNNEISARWGGVILLGRTYIAKNQPSTGAPVFVEQQIEGVPGNDALYGGTNDDDNSGQLSYMSIRYGGSVLQPDMEINGLTMGAVGRGTTIHHIEVVNNIDDGFEWFGGTVNTKYLIVWNSGDDGFDSDMGFRGKCQFGLVVKGVSKAGATNGSGMSNFGMEMDGPETPTNGKPYGFSQWRNLTLIGLLDSENNANDGGLMIRENCRPQIYHCILMDNGGYGANVEHFLDGRPDSFGGWTTPWNGTTAGIFDGDATNPMQTALYGGTNGAQHQGFQTEIADCLFYHTHGLSGAPDSSAAIDNTGVGIMTGKQNSVPASSPIRSITRQAATGYANLQIVKKLDPRATTVAQTLNRPLATEGFFDVVGYRGAFGPTSNWAAGWTLISAMGVLDTSTQVGTPQTVISANVTTSTTWTNDHEYVLNGLIYVTNGATLTIQPGTVIRGMPDSDTAGDFNPGTLIVARGAQLIANGTAANPIIFTDMDDDNVPGGAHASATYNNNPNNEISARWGGVILLGRTYIAKNQPSTGAPVFVEQQIEGVPGNDALYGGTNDDDNSGQLSYMSIRYGGSVLQPDMEINGLTMGAVGRGTTIHHIEVVNNIDDGFEWFGGTVNTKYLIVWNSGDDGFDSDMGFRGKCQFGLVVKGVSKAGATNGSGMSNFGMEMDGPETPTNGKPYGFSQWRNLTLIGLLDSENNANDGGLMIRENCRPQIYHCILMDNGGYGANVEHFLDGRPDSFGGWTTPWNGTTAGIFDGDATNPMQTALYGGTNGAQHQGFQTEIADCLFYHTHGLSGAPDSSAAIDNTGVGIMTGKQNSVPASSPIRSITRQAATGYANLQIVKKLDPRPTSVAQGINKTLTAEGFFDVVNYRGAFATNDRWADGWTLISAMGVLEAAPADVTQTIPLVNGWNWISFNVIPANNSLQAVLAAYGPLENDQFKTAPALGGSASYDGTTWWGIDGGIQPGVMYLFKVQRANPVPSLVVTGPAVDPALAIALVNGWNWVGFTGSAATPLATALAGHAWNENDQIKTAPTLGGSASYDGTTWWGMEEVGGLLPGAGYKLKVQAASPAPLIFGH